MTDAPPPLVLLHSPLVGPLTWRPTAAALRDRGYQVTVPELRFGAGPDFHGRLAAQAAAAATAIVAPARDSSDPDSPDDAKEASSAAAVLVVHSGAGALVPAVAALLRGTPLTAIFVDALLPHPGRTWYDTVDAETAAALRGLAADGLLPPWNTWFAPEALDALLADPGQREAFVADLAPIPAAYFEEKAPELPTPPGVYIRTSEAYAAEADAAERLGWPVVRLPLENHLAPLTHPAEIAEAVDGVLAGTHRR